MEEMEITKPKEHPTSSPQEMCIVQLPVEQIYRSLPSTNSSSTAAQINSNPTTPRHKFSHAYLFLWIFFIFIFIAVLLFVIFSILYLVAKPRSPKFSIENFTTSSNLDSNGSQVHNSSLKYEIYIYMKAENPNSHVGLDYKKGGHAALTFKEHEIAEGEPPSFYQPKKNSTYFVVVLESLKREELPPPPEVIRVEGGQEVVPLKVSIHVHVRLKIWQVKVWSVEMTITCSVRVNGLTKTEPFLSDGCHHKVHV